MSARALNNNTPDMYDIQGSVIIDVKARSDFPSHLYCQIAVKTSVV